MADDFKPPFESEQRIGFFSTPTRKTSAKSGKNYWKTTGSDGIDYFIFSEEVAKTVRDGQFKELTALIEHSGRFQKLIEVI